MRALAFAFLLLILPAISHAQAIPGGAIPLNVSISPTYPRPYDTITVTVTSNVIDLAASTIIITADGKTIAENNRSGQVQLKGVGASTLIDVKATGADYAYDQKVSVSPADVSLVVEPSTSVPLLYQGAALPSAGSSVRIVALADLRDAKGVRIPSSKLAYTWKLGEQILEAQSGLGKNILVATAPARYRDAQVSVTVSTQDHAMNAHASVSVSPIDPFLRVYVNDPLLGIDFLHAVTSATTLGGQEETFRAVPFYFAGTPTVAWTLNGGQSGTDPDLTVRSTGSTAGSALIGATASGGGATAQSRFTLQFGSASSGIFGL